METEDGLFAFLTSQKAAERTLIIYQSRWLLFTQLALMAIIPQVALTVLVRKTLAADVSLFEMTWDGAIFRLVEVVSYFVFNTIIQAVMVKVVAEYYAQKQSTWNGSLSILWDRLCAIFGYVALYTLYGYAYWQLSLCFLLGDFHVLVALLVLAFWVIDFFRLLGKLTIALPVVIMDKQRTLDALNRSDQLLAVHYWYFIGSVSLLVVPVLLAVALYSVALEKMLSTSVLSIVLNSLPGILFLPIRTILVTVLYFSIRVQFEGLNRETLVKQLEVEIEGAENYTHMTDGGEAA